MRPSEWEEWVCRGERRRRVLGALAQPLTARQLSLRTGLFLKACSAALGELAVAGLVVCLTPRSRRSRIYWLTDVGARCARRFTREGDPVADSAPYPIIDWHLYGSLCFRHRSAVLRALVEPMQPAAIKRYARFKDPTLRMSSTHCREVVRHLLDRDLVVPVRVRKQAFPRYELTDLGRQFQILLMKAEGWT